MTATPLLVLLSVACAQVGGAIARTLFPALGPPGVLLLRLAVAAVAGLLILDQRLGPVPIAALVLVSVASLGVTWQAAREPLPAGPPPRPVR